MSLPPDNSQTARVRSTWILWVAVAYFLTAKLGLEFRTEPEKFAIFWPSNGFLLGLLLVCPPKRRWPLILTCAVTSAAANWLAGFSVEAILGFTFVNIGEPCLAAWTLARLSGGRFLLQSPRDVYVLFANSLVVCAVSASFGATTVVYGLGAPSYPSAWIAFWLSDAMAIMLVTPVILGFDGFHWSAVVNVPGWRRLEAAVLATALIGLTAAVFAQPSAGRPWLLSFAFPAFPLLLWSALRFGLQLTTGVILAVALTAIWFTGRGLGPFANEAVPVADRLLMVQLFLSVLSLSSLALATAFIERQYVQRSLESNEKLLQHFIENSPAAIAMFDREMRYLKMSTRWLTDYHLAGRDIVGVCHYDVMPDIPDRWKEAVQRVLAGAVERCDEDPFPRDDGSIAWLEWECRPWRNTDDEIGGVILFTQLITDRKIAEQQMLASLKEKEVLLKEIHHRVKNNLQIVSTLLDLQSDQTSDPAALEMFRESRGRVKSMALIHERLYRSDELARVDFTEYIGRLADDLYQAYKVSNEQIRLEVDVSIGPVPIDIAIPCGLLLNELMTNCFKHGFRDRDAGRISITMAQESGNSCVMIVADDGTGLPDGVDFRNTQSFGLQLVITLVEQLSGHIDFSAQPGTTATIRFPIDGR